MNETRRFLGTPGAIRIAAAILLVLLVLASPMALMFAGLSVMAFDAGPSVQATTFVSIVWGAVFLLFVAALLAFIALIAPRRGLVIAAFVLALPCTLAVGLLIGVAALTG